MRTITLAASLVGFASPALSKPVYLDCLMTFQRADPRHWQISFDEADASLSWSSDNGHAGKMPAVFTAATVTGTDHLNDDTTRIWTINRETGAATDAFFIGTAAPVQTEGTCKAVTPHRQF